MESMKRDYAKSHLKSIISTKKNYVKPSLRSAKAEKAVVVAKTAACSGSSSHVKLHAAV